MGKFSLRGFVMSTIRRMVSGGEVNYRIMQYAAGWYDRDVLLDDDMIGITTLIEEREQTNEDVLPEETIQEEVVLPEEVIPEEIIPEEVVIPEEVIQEDEVLPMPEEDTPED